MNLRVFANFRVSRDFLTALVERIVVRQKYDIREMTTTTAHVFLSMIYFCSNKKTRLIELTLGS